MRRRALPALIVVALAATLGLAGCTGDPGEGSSSSGWVVSGSQSPGPAQTVSPAPSLDPVLPDETSVAPRVAESDAPGQIVSASAAEADDGDVLTFTFASGSIPGYDIRYVDRLERGADDVVMLAGEAALAVTLTNSTLGSDGTIGADIVTNSTFDLPLIRQVLLATNLGGTVTFGVGLATQVPFTVTISGDTLAVAFQPLEG